MRANTLFKATAVAGMLHAVSAGAVQVVPVSYSMANGTTGGYHYWDDTYNGTGCKTCDGAALSGGLGDLTDGILASASFAVTETTGHGPYVAWRDVNPTITFNFGSTQTFQDITLAFDYEAAYSVLAPASVVINGTSYTINAPSTSGPFTVVISPASLVTNTITMTLVRNGSWTFISEAKFNSITAVPELPSSTLLAAGLGVLLVPALRRRRAQQY